MPNLIDLFCGEGGAAEGYERAGWTVTGVDIKRMPRFRGHAFVQADVMGLTVEYLQQFDAIHASPPCQGYSDMKSAPGAKNHPLLIHPVQRLLEASGKPWVIENVEGAAAHMPGAIMLCGTMFGLGAAGHQLQRHRLFLASFPLPQPACRHGGEPVIGVYGGHVRNRSATKGGRGTVDFAGYDKPALAAEAMGLAGRTMDGLSQAIPPAYTQFIGQHLLAHHYGF